MVLPLIPAVLIAVGAVTGGGGATLGGLGVLDFKKAAERRKAAVAKYDERRAQSERNVAFTNDLLGALGREQQQALVDVVLRMREFLVRHEKQVRESERLLVEGVDAQANQIPGLGRLNVDAVAWVGGAIGSAVTSVGTGVGVSTLAGAVGTASTGTAISALSGVAAENALLAWLGGGSLAAGGGGVALGGMALNFVTVGPALLVGGLVTKGQGAKELTKAREDEAKIAVAIAELDELDARLAAVNSRAEELNSVLGGLRDRAIVALDELESEPFDPPVHAGRFQRAMSLVIAVRDVAAAPIIDDSGDLTEQSATLSVKYRSMAEDDNG
ncbi:MAG: hypothetical protein FGM52_03365 [Mycobacterium sp.]|nr:hypothetical protein [Mycobacterium sp.]